VFKARVSRHTPLASGKRELARIRRLGREDVRWDVAFEVRYKDTRALVRGPRGVRGRRRLRREVGGGLG